VNGQISRDVEPKTIDLETSISKALFSSSDIRYLRFDQKIADQKVKLGLRQFFPVLGLGFSNSDSVVYGAPDSRLRKLFIELDQLVFDGGRLAQSYKNQKNELKLNLLALDLKREEIIFSVINLYTEILKVSFIKKIQQETLLSAMKQFLIAGEEYKLGVITQLELFDIQLAVANYELELAETEKKQRLINFRFARMLGYPPEEAPPLSGYINAEYSGFIGNEDVDTAELSAYYIDKAKKNSLEFMSKRLNLLQSKELLNKARWSSLPNIKANLELSMSGDHFPLSEPGFSLGLEFGFDLPASPLQATTTLGKQNPDERSTGLSATVEPVTNLAGLYSRQIAATNLSKTRKELDDFGIDTGFAIEENLEEIRNQRKTLDLLRQKLKIEKSRLKIQELRAQLGEIKRIDLLNSEIELSKNKVEILSKVVELYNTEISLLKSSGIFRLKDTHRYIVVEKEVSL